MTATRTLTVIACAAGPAAELTTLVKLARDRGWAVQVVATPSALGFFDQAAIEEQTGNPVRSEYANPEAPRSLIPDAVLVAPATYNTINKWAQGISDTYALGVLAEVTGMGIPVVVLPFVNSALACAPRSGAALIPAKRRSAHPARPRRHPTAPAPDGR